MPTSIMTSREFNQDCSGAKIAARNGPVIITDRGKPAHVLLTIEEFTRLKGKNKSLLEALAAKPGGDFEFDPPKLNLHLRPADFN